MLVPQSTYLRRLLLPDGIFVRIITQLMICYYIWCKGTLFFCEIQIFVRFRAV